MEILIIAGTGAMGTHLINLLSDSNIEVFVTSRKKRESSGRIHYLHGDAQDIIFLRSILNKHWDTIVDFMVYSTESFKKRVDLLLGATAQYIFLSSSRVYANSNIPIHEKSLRLLDESNDEKFLLTDEYSLSKARQENILKCSMHKNWTIICPYITYSENRLQLGVFEKEDWLYRALKGKTIVFSREINFKLTTMTYGLDVARVIVKLIGDPGAIGEIFNITSSRAEYWGDVLKIYLDTLEKKLGYRPKVLLADLGWFLKSHRSKYQILYDRLFDRRFDNSKIANFINIDNFVKIEYGLNYCLNKFLENPIFNNIDWRLEALCDRKVKESAPLKDIPTFKNKVIYLYYRYI